MIIGVINRHFVAANRKMIKLHGHENVPDLMPVIRISEGRYKTPTYYCVYEFENKSGRIIGNGYKNPLPCGATCWIEFDD